jgi:beta-N-acetylhexosaminidase
MSKYYIFFGSVLLLCGAGLFFFFNHTTVIITPIRPEAVAPAVKLPLDYTVGGVVMIGHWADTPVASTTALIQKYQVAGVVIMSAPDNVADITAWTNEWQRASTYPLLIAIDQEGGEVSRLRGEGFTADEQRTLLTESAAYELGKKRGEELAALGINMNFAPVLDIATSSDAFLYNRAFNNPDTAGAFAAAMTRGMAESGVIAAAKHFPGHPNTPADSHFTLPEVPIEKTELTTFTQQFQNYITLANPQAIMTAHVAFPRIDEVPATLSHFFLTEYLRQTLGFGGVIITDDMSMDAISTIDTIPEASVSSILAGSDILLLAADPASINDVVPVLTAAQQQTGAFADRLRHAQRRVFTLRTSLD